MSIILFFFLCVLWVVLAAGLPSWVKHFWEREHVPPAWAIIIAAIALMTVHYRYTHYSPEAKARETLDTIVDLWRADHQSEAVDKLREAAATTPWRPDDRLLTEDGE